MSRSTRIFTRSFVLVLSIMLVLPGIHAQQAIPEAQVTKRANDLLKQMTLDEKVA